MVVRELELDLDAFEGPFDLLLTLVLREEIDLAEVVADAVRRYESQAAMFGVELVVDAPLPAPALADADRVVQVVSNLVENAIRLTPRGGTVRLVARAGMISVSDTGPGLRPNELPRAFERFYLHDRYGRARRVGTGLGLAIVKELTEAMGGRVSVDSDTGRGAEFVVQLPPATVSESAAAPETERETVAGRIRC